MAKSHKPTKTIGLALVATVAIVAAVGVWVDWPSSGADGVANPYDRDQVRQGKAVYADHCAACHGGTLEGQPDWRRPLADGRLPAPPHDSSGHTWHHPDRQLFDITKFGIARFAPAGYRTDMTGFGEVLSDADIWAVLAYIKSTWPREIRMAQDARNRP